MRKAERAKPAYEDKHKRITKRGGRRANNSHSTCNEITALEKKKVNAHRGGGSRCTTEKRGCAHRTKRSEALAGTCRRPIDEKSHEGQNWGKSAKKEKEMKFVIKAPKCLRRP